MENSPEQIGNTPAANSPMSKLTRCGFIAASAATVASCKAATPLASTTASSSAAAAVNPPVKSTANKEYKTPAVDGPSLRNNAGSPSSNFSKDAGVTFSRVLVSGNYIAITYDDGPHPQNTPRLLDMLAKRNIKATFYVIGRSVNLHPGVLRRTVAEGHEVGNHSHTHRLLSKLGDSEVRKEMQLCQDAIAKAAGVRPRTMRPPYGGLLQRQRELIHKEFGYPTILWSVDPLDWKRPGASVIASRILKNTTQGGIVLAHDLHSQTVDSMPATLDGLLKKGFKFVTVSQLIAMKIDAGAAQASVTPNS